MAWLTRRSFVGAAVGFGLVGCASSRETARLRVGILSDTHIREPAVTCASAESTAVYGDGFRKGLPTSSESFRQALEYFRDRGADAVLICGDICDLGLVSQLATVRRLWNEVFPNDLAPDGRRVERLFITGNHEWEGPNYKCTAKLWPDDGDRAKRFFPSDPARIWEEIFEEKYEPLSIRSVKGYDFVLAHYGDKTGVPGLAEFLESHRARLAGNKPFFYAQHLHPKGTCSSPMASADEGFSTAALSVFPNAVAFSGHSHFTLSDERTIWQGSFTSVGCSSLRFVQTIPDVDNGNRKSPADAPMEPIDGYEGRQGLFMTVYDDRLVLERRDFLRGQSVGDDWTIPLDATTRPYAFETRAAEEPLPRFPAKSVVAAMRVPVRFRDGVVRDAFSLTFPPALPSPGSPRTSRYEIVAEAGGVKFPPRTVLSPGAIFAEAADVGRVVCVYPAEEIPAGAVVDFTITPIGCFGARGTSLAYRFDAR